MFVPDPSASAAPQPQPSDIQQLVGLLGNLIPLLQRFQSQTFQPQPFPFQGFEQPFQNVPGQNVPGYAAIPNPALVNPALAVPALDRLAAENLAGDIISGSLCTLSAYLEANVGRHTGVENCVPIVTQAAHRFAGRDYAEAFNLIWLAYRTIETIRITDPQLPPLRQSGQVPPDQTSSSIH